MDERWTILKVLQWTTAFFGKKGIEQPRANAEVLLAHVLNMPRIQLYLHYDQPLAAAELARYRQVVQRRAAFEPTQYITGKQEFWSLEFEVNSSVLIPRPETEILVEKAVELLGSGPRSVLDIGTGSGAIAVALASQCPEARIVATDRSFGALAVAVRNALRHNVRDRISFLAADLFSAFLASGVSFDLIVSNPPYIGDREFEELPPEIARHEPEGALRGGGIDGLAVIRKILDAAPAYLAPGGCLLMEIGKGQDEWIRREYANSRVDSSTFIRDYSGVPRVLYWKSNG